MSPKKICWVSNEHMERCTSLYKWEMQITTIMKYPYTPLEWLELKRLTTPSFGEDVEKLACTTDENVK